jgi:hypothetical protein
MCELQNAHIIKHQFTISNKTECLHLLKKSSDKLLNVLDTFKWFKLASKIGFQVKNNIENPISNDFKSSLFQFSPKFKEMINYLEKHLNDFTCKEKALAFKILATINQLSQSYNDEKLSNLLVKYETDYYDNIDKYDLVDFNNYTDAFCMFREENVYFASKTADPVYQLSYQLVESKNLRYSYAVFKYVYFINKKLCMKYKNLNPIWFFDKCKPIIKENQQSGIVFFMI